MTLSLKEILGVVTFCAIVLAGILGTLRLPGDLCEVPVGILFAAFVVLVTFGAARLVSMKLTSDRFWLGFLVIAILCFGLCSSSAISSYHTLTKHMARFLFLSLPTIPESVDDQLTRFYVLKCFLDLVLALILAFGSGLVASRSRRRLDTV